MAGEWVDVQDEGRWVDHEEPKESSWSDRLRALGHGARKGASLGFDEEIGGATQALMQAITGAAKNPDGSPMTAMDVYRQSHAGNVGDEARTKKAASRFYAGGEVLGGLVPGLATGGGGTLGSAVKSGIALGAAGGLGDSDADLTRLDAEQVKQALLDAGAGGLAGGASGAAGYGIGKALPVALRAARTKLEDLAVGTGRRVLNGGAELANATKKVVSDEAVREALNRGTIKPFGTTKGAFNRLERTTDEVGDVYQSVLGDLEQGGVKGPHPRDLANTLIAAGRAAEPNTFNTAIPRLYESVADQALDKTGGSAMSLTQAEALKRSLQEMAKADYANLSTKSLGKARMDIASKMRQSIEDTVGQQADGLPVGNPAREAADAFVPVKKSLGNLIEAREAARKGANKASGANSAGLAEKLALYGSLMMHDPSGLALLAGKGLMNRGASTVAASSHTGAQLARALAQGAAKAGNKLPAGTALGTADLVRALRSKRQRPIINVGTGEVVGYENVGPSEE